MADAADGGNRGDILLLVTGLVTPHLTQIMPSQSAWILPNQLQRIVMMIVVVIFLMMKFESVIVMLM